MNNDEYFIPLEPNHALALTMNFPQFSESTPSENLFTEKGVFVIKALIYICFEMV